MSEFWPNESDDFDRWLAERTPPVDFDYDARLAGNRELNSAFNSLHNRLKRFYAINKASLALYDDASGAFRVTLMKEDGLLKTGLALNFSAAKVTMFQVLKQGFPVADNFPEHISNSIIEKRIILGPDTRAVLLIPLIYEGRRMGVLNLASSESAAFGLYLEGIGEGIVGEFCERLYHILTATCA